MIQNYSDRNYPQSPLEESHAQYFFRGLGGQRSLFLEGHGVRFARVWGPKDTNLLLETGGRGSGRQTRFETLQRIICWAEVQQLALIGSSSSLHSEACNALGASDGVISYNVILLYIIYIYR